jgi:hypothetical protein
VAEIIRNEFRVAVGVTLLETKYVAAIYDIPADETYIQLKGVDDLSIKRARTALRDLKSAIRAAE